VRRPGDIFRGGLQFAGGGGGVPLAQQIAASLPYSWTNAANYTVDGVTGRVATQVELVAPGTGIRATVPGHAFAQTVLAQQVLIPVARPALNNQPAWAWAGAQVYVSNAPAAAWSFLNSGAAPGWRIYFAYEAPPNGLFLCLFATAGATALAGGTAIGTLFDLFVIGANQSQELRIANGTGAGVGVVMNNSAATPLASGAPAWVSMSYLEGGGPPEWEQRCNGSLRSSGNSANAPSAAAPLVTAREGRDGVNANPSSAGTYTAERIVYDRTPDAATDALVRAYFAAKYGTPP
jgi:hypothetical protein